MNARTATDPRTERVLREIADNPRLLRIFRPDLTRAECNELLEENLDGSPAEPAEPPAADPGDLTKAVNNPLLEEDFEGTPGFPAAPPSLFEPELEDDDLSL